MSVASQSLRPENGGQLIGGDLDLPALGAALWRKKWRILAPTIAVALATFAIVQLIPAKYLSESKVLIEERGNIFLRPDVERNLTERPTVDPEAVTSQVQLILSRDLATEVIAKLKLNERAEFDPALAKPSLWRSLLALVGVGRIPANVTPQERVLDAYYARLQVYPVEKSRVIVIGFLSEDPELAARAANAIADAYLVRQQSAKQDQARSAGLWLSGEIETMRRKVADAEAKVEAFRSKSNLLLGPNNTSLSAQQLGDLTGQLAAARAQRADAEAKAKLIREWLHSNTPIESSAILNSELIRRLSEQRVTLRAQLAEQSSSLLDGHPRIKELRAQIADLDRQIRGEAETIARSFENDAKLAAARLDSMTVNLDQLKTLAAGTNEQDVQLRALERDAKSQRDLLESYLAKYREASAREGINSAPADARVISQATVSNIPAYPKKLPTILIATLATLILCCGWVLTRELLDAPEAEVAPVADAPAAVPAERIVVTAAAPQPPVPKPAPVIAAPDAPSIADPEPELRAASVAEEAPLQPGGNVEADEFAAKPAPLLAVPISAIDDVAYSLQQGDTGGRIAVLAASAGLDATGVAIKLARALAASARVILVGLGGNDEAIRAISSHPAAPGMAELAAGTASFRDIITRDHKSGLDLIASGRVPADRVTVLSTPAVPLSFDALARSYDHVVIDAGVLGGAEMEALGEIAPHAIVVTQALSNDATTSARDSLIAAGFDDITILVGARGATPAPKVAAA